MKTGGEKGKKGGRRDRPGDDASSMPEQKQADGWSTRERRPLLLLAYHICATPAIMSDNDNRVIPACGVH